MPKCLLGAVRKGNTFTVCSLTGERAISSIKGHPKVTKIKIKMLQLIYLPYQRIAIIQNVNASLLISIDLIATDDAFSVAKGNDARAKATVDSITLPLFFMHGGEKKEYKKTRVREVYHTKSRTSTCFQTKTTSSLNARSYSFQKNVCPLLDLTEEGLTFQ